jgi:hypothetical protein
VGYRAGGKNNFYCRLWLEPAMKMTLFTAGTSHGPVVKIIFTAGLRPTLFSLRSVTQASSDNSFSPPARNKDRR